MKRVLAILLLGALLGACGNPSAGPAQEPEARGGDKDAGQEPGSDPAQLYEFYGMVMDDADSGPELCVGGIATSLPPQCGGPPITNWDWAAVKGEEHELLAPGADPPDEWEISYGTYYVVGTFDGKRFTLTETPTRQQPARLEPSYDEDSFETPCPRPEGGWVVDPAKAEMPLFWKVLNAAERDPDSGGVWMDYVQGHVESPDNVIANVTFTGDLARHERELREIWGGGLCVSHARYSTDHLTDVRKELETSVLQEMGLQMVSSSIAVGTTNYVEIGVVVFTAQQQAQLDERYGEGAVKLYGELQPLSY